MTKRIKKTREIDLFLYFAHQTRNDFGWFWNCKILFQKKTKNYNLNFPAKKMNKIPNSWRRMPPLPTTSDLLRLYGIKAKKKLSQNFILDPRILQRFVKIGGKYTKHILYKIPKKSLIKAPFYELLQVKSKMNMLLKWVRAQVELPGQSLMPRLKRSTWSKKIPDLFLLLNWFKNRLDLNDYLLILEIVYILMLLVSFINMIYILISKNDI